MLVVCDASQLEWRVALELSRDPIGIDEILKKDDVHSNNEKAFMLPSRLIAKIYLFRTIFKGSGWAFANDPDFMHVSSDPAFWDELNIKFYSKYKGLDACHNKWKDEVVAGRPIKGPLGRSWSISLKRDKWGNLKIPWTTLSNYPVQGTGADVMMFARISVYNRIKAAKIPCKFLGTVHDNIIVDCKEQYIQAIVNIFHEVFRDIPKNIKAVFGYEWVVPLDCECKYGPNMKAMKKIAPAY